MELTLLEINQLFNKLIELEFTREEADRWAFKRIQAFDSGVLQFLPQTDEEILWSAIQYLYGIDIKISPDEYMHSIDDIQEEFEKTWKLKDESQ